MEPLVECADMGSDPQMIRPHLGSQAFACTHTQSVLANANGSNRYGHRRCVLGCTCHICVYVRSHAAHERATRAGPSASLDFRCPPGFILSPVCLPLHPLLPGTPLCLPFASCCFRWPPVAYSCLPLLPITLCPPVVTRCLPLPPFASFCLPCFSNCILFVFWRTWPSFFRLLAFWHII